MSGGAKPRIRKLVGADEIGRRVRDLGAQIARDYAGREICVVAILKGSCVFLADLMRALSEQDVSVHFEFIDVKRSGSDSGDEIIDIYFGTHFSVEGRDILILKDVMNTGVIESYLLAQLRAHQPREIRIAALVNKPKDRKVELEPDYFGFELPDGIYVGYGLEYEGLHGNLPYLGAVEA